MSLLGRVETTNEFLARVRIGRVKRNVFNGIGANRGELVRIQQGIIVEKIAAEEQKDVQTAYAHALRPRKKKSNAKQN